METTAPREGLEEYAKSLDLSAAEVIDLLEGVLAGTIDPGYFVPGR